MKAFLSRLGSFTGILTMILVAITVLIPPTPRTQTSLLFSKLDKDKLLETTPPPRLILIGGSNMSMGIDSSLLKEELDLHPINMAIHASIGLEYLTDQVLDDLQPGDVLIISMEYSQFYGQQMYGGEELLRTVFDVDRSDLGSLDPLQWLSISRFVPKYAISKIKPGEYFYKIQEEIGVYEREAFNQFGDATLHWTREADPVDPYPEIAGGFNRQSVRLLIDFNEQVKEKGGALLITYPAIQEQTYQNMEEQINRVESELKKSGLTLLGTPESFIVADDLLFDTPYHLTQEGAIYRTNLLIDALRSLDNLID